MIRFGLLARVIPCGGHIFTDSFRDLLSYCEHFFTGNIFRKVHVDVNGQPGQIEDGQVNGRSAFQRQRVEKQCIPLNEVQHVGQTADLFKGVTDKA